MWKRDLERHENETHEDIEALLLLISTIYTNWDICEIHHALLQVAFNLANHD
jgi:hypothetical protein